jgi:hypothetical protein
MSPAFCDCLLHEKMSKLLGLLEPVPSVSPGSSSFHIHFFPCVLHTSHTTLLKVPDTEGLGSKTGLWPVVPATLEAEVGGSLEPRSARPAWEHK